MSSIIFHGSLRDHGLLEIVLGRPVDPRHLGPVRAEGFATLRLADEAYPMLVPAPGRQAEGVLLHHVTEADLDRLAFFAGAKYDLAPVTVTTASGSATNGAAHGDELGVEAGRPPH